MKNVVCFDVGGTFIKYAVINSLGEILCKGKFPTPEHNCKITIPEKMIGIIGEMFFKELNNRFKKRAIKDYADHTNIVQAQLKNDAGIYGACYIAL